MASNISNTSDSIPFPTPFHASKSPLVQAFMRKLADQGQIVKNVSRIPASAISSQPNQIGNSKLEREGDMAKNISDPSVDSLMNFLNNEFRS